MGMNLRWLRRQSGSTGRSWRHDRERARASVVGIMHRGPEAGEDFEYVDFYVASRCFGRTINNEPEKCDLI